MNAKWDFLGNTTEGENADLVAEGMAVSVQLAIQKAMMRGGVSQKDLAEKLGVSTARVSQILSAHGRNLTLRTLGKIAYALGEDFEFLSLRDLRDLKAKSGSSKARRSSTDLSIALVEACNPWTDTTANENRFPGKIAA